MTTAWSSCWVTKYCLSALLSALLYTIGDNCFLSFLVHFLSPDSMASESRISGQLMLGYSSGVVRWGVDIGHTSLDTAFVCLLYNTPAQLALTASVSINLKGRWGRSPKCLLSMLRADMDKAWINTQTTVGLEELRKHAADKDQWEEIIEHISSA